MSESSVGLAAIMGIMQTETQERRNVGPLPLILGGGLVGLLRKSAPWERLATLVR